MKRREFIKFGSQATLAGTALAQLTACSSGSDSPKSSAGGGENNNNENPDTPPTPPEIVIDDLGYKGALPFIHGVASGDPLHDRVILWTRVTHDGSVTASRIPVGYTVATDPEFKSVVKNGKTYATAESDFTVKVDPILPNADSTYYYKFEALGFISPVGRTRTIPHPNTPAHEVERTRLAVVSCSNYAFGYFNGYADIARQADIAAVLHLGDYIYEHQEGFYFDPSMRSQRPLDPKHEIVSLDDYRRRYALYRTDIDLQECHRQHPFIVVWDDHEITNDAWMEGAQNHQLNEGNYIERKMSAVRAYHEWMPIRSHNSNELDSQLRIYRRFQFGKLFDLNMLDTRIFGRQKPDVTASNKPERQLLGLEQENWLYFNLLDGKDRGATWQLLGQQVILAPFKGSSATSSSDIWNGYASARTRLLNFIENNDINNTVVLTGDYHASFAFDLCQNPFDKASYNPDTGEGSIGVEFVCPALTSGTFPEIAGSILNPHQKFNEQFSHGYILLDITEDACQSEWYFVNTLKERNSSCRFAKGLRTQVNQHHLVDSAQTFPSRGDALAPQNKAIGLKKEPEMAQAV